MDLKELFLRTLPRLKLEVDTIIGTIREKGANRFARPLIVGGFVILVGYQLLYMPPKKKIKGLDRQIAAAQAIATYADEYMAMRDQIRAAHARLPPLKEKETWLFEKVRETLLQENLVAENLAPPTAGENFGVSYQRMLISLQLPFPQLVVFIQRLEGVKPFMHVSSIDLTKDQAPDKLGRNAVNFEISTVIPVRRPG